MMIPMTFFDDLDGRRIFSYIKQVETIDNTLQFTRVIKDEFKLEAICHLIENPININVNVGISEAGSITAWSCIDHDFKGKTTGNNSKNLHDSQMLIFDVIAGTDIDDVLEELEDWNYIIHSIPPTENDGREYRVYLPCETRFVKKDMTKRHAKLKKIFTTAEPTDLKSGVGFHSPVKVVDGSYYIEKQLNQENFDLFDIQIGKVINKNKQVDITHGGLFDE